MNEQISEQNTPVAPDIKVAETGFKKAIVLVKEKSLTVVKNLLSRLKESKIYKNKLIFWTMTSLFGILFLVLILGLLFGNRNKNTSSTSTPIPIAQNTTPVITQEDGPLFQINQRLKDLKTQIMTFDVKQSRLKPPSVNFDVKF